MSPYQKKTYSQIWVLFFCCMLFISAFPSCSYFSHELGLEEDNIAEEILEDIILIRTGVDVDLTPATQE